MKDLSFLSPVNFAEGEYEKLSTMAPTIEQSIKERRTNVSKTINLAPKQYGTVNYSTINTTFERNTSMIDNSTNITRTYYSIDRDTTTDISSIKISKHPSLREEEVPSEGAGNIEICNILRHIDRIKIDSSDDSSRDRDWEENKISEKPEFSAVARQNSKKMF